MDDNPIHLCVAYGLLCAAVSLATVMMTYRVIAL
jgi:hypothetical protein